MAGAAPVGAPGAGRAHAMMLLYAFLVSTSFPVGRVLTQEIDPVVVTFLRFALAAAVFAGIVGARGGRFLPGPRDMLRGAALALPLVVFFVAMFEALRWTDTLSTGAIFTLMPLMSAGIAVALLRERLSAPLAAALVAGGCGALWVLARGDLGRLLALDFGYGEGLFLLGCCAFAAYAPLIRKLHGGHPIHRLTFWSLLTGTVMLAIVGAPRIWATDWAALPVVVFLGVAYLAVCNTALTFYLAKSSSVVLTPAKVMAYTFLTPGFVALLEGSLGQGWPEPIVYVGIALTTLAMLAMLKVE